MELEADVKKGILDWGWVALIPGIKPVLRHVPIPQVGEVEVSQGH